MAAVNPDTWDATDEADLVSCERQLDRLQSCPRRPVDETHARTIAGQVQSCVEWLVRLRATKARLT